MIASQSIISGAYSMTQQAISLNFLPRMEKWFLRKAARSARFAIPLRQLGACPPTHAARGGHRLRLIGRAFLRAFAIAVSLLMK